MVYKSPSMERDTWVEGKDKRRELQNFGAATAYVMRCAEACVDYDFVSLHHTNENGPSQKRTLIGNSWFGLVKICLHV